MTLQKERTAGGLGYSKTYLKREVAISLKSEAITLKNKTFIPRGFSCFSKNWKKKVKENHKH